MWKILRVFYGFLLEKKAVFILFVLLMGLVGATNAVLPFLNKTLIERIADKEVSTLSSLIAVYLAFIISKLFLWVLAMHMGDHVLIDTAASARKKVFKYLHDLDFAYHANRSTGSLISAMKRGDSAFFSFFFALNQRVIEVVIGFTTMFITFVLLQPIVGIVAFVSLLLTLAVCFFAIRYNLVTRAVFNETEDEVSAIIVDNMIGFETVKLFAKEKWEQKRLDDAFKKWKKALWVHSNSFRIYDVSIGIPLNISIGLVLYMTVLNITNGAFQLGDFVVILTFINVFFPQVWELIWAFRDIGKNYTDIEKYFAILDNKIEVKDPEKILSLPPISGQIDFEKVGFTYNKSKHRQIKDFDLNIKSGESVALVGRSGAGKTTIVKLLMRFYDVDSGAIKIDGIDIKDMTKEQLRSLIGVVPQEPVLFNNTISYNIAYGADNADEKQIKAAAKMANIYEFIESLPEKWETHVGERGIKLSGGQKQRLAIARMILSNPKIIIFDEATSHLDSESEKLIQEAFWKAAKGKTTIIIAHRLSTVMRSDKIVVIEKGKISEIGTHKELVANHDSLYKYLWDLQINIT